MRTYRQIGTFSRGVGWFCLSCKKHWIGCILLNQSMLCCPSSCHKLQRRKSWSSLECLSFWRSCPFECWICTNFRKCWLSLGNFPLGRPAHQSSRRYRSQCSQHMVWIRMWMVERASDSRRSVKHSRRLKSARIT